MLIFYSPFSLVDLPQEICDRLFKQSQLLTLEDIFIAFNILVSTQEMTKRLDSQRIPLEISLVRLAYSKTAKELKSKVVLENKEQRIPDEIATQKPTIQQNTSISLESIKNVWGNIVNRLASVKMSVSTYLSEGNPTKVQGEVLTIAFPKNYLLHKESLDRKENKLIIENAIFECCNANLKVNFILTEQVMQGTDAHSNPFIKSALEMFGGRVIKEE